MNDAISHEVLAKLVDEQLPPLGLEQLSEIAERSYQMLELVRKGMLAPDARKKPPTFSGVQVAALCGIDPAVLIRRLAKKDLPEGTFINRARRQFTLAEALVWVRAYRAQHLRPAGARGVVFSCANFKGGSTKTSTTVALAQGLSLLGHKVLVIDLDAQGTATNLFGIYSETEVAEEDTLSDFFAGHSASIVPCIRKTYWDGISLIPAGPSLFGADLALPTRQARDPSIRFWEVLRRAMVEVVNDFDIIVIDTPPSLSPVTVNALMASDGLVIPLPPSTLDFASSAQFFGLFADMTQRLYPADQGGKEFGFLHILLSKVNSADAATPMVRDWIRETYGQRVLATEIPFTSVATVTSAQFGTVYDVTRYSGGQKTYERAREAYDRATLQIEQSVSREWKRQGAV